MKILIVSKTHVKGMACVGGLDLDRNRSLRLLQPNGSNQPPNTALEVGEVWDMTYSARPDVIPPHVEDVLIASQKMIGKQPRLKETLLGEVTLWRGGPQSLFDGQVQFTLNGSGYISHRTGVPSCSTGYWIADADLDYDPETRRYVCADGPWRFSYVGFALPVPKIAEGSLIRVSLARWWRPDDMPNMEERCYVQLSGWFE